LHARARRWSATTIGLLGALLSTAFSPPASLRGRDARSVPHGTLSVTDSGGPATRGATEPTHPQSTHAVAAPPAAPARARPQAVTGRDTVLATVTSGDGVSQARLTPQRLIFTRRRDRSIVRLQFSFPLEQVRRLRYRDGVLAPDFVEPGDTTGAPSDYRCFRVHAVGGEAARRFIAQFDDAKAARR
jgi:hypothetical protein